MKTKLLFLILAINLLFNKNLLGNINSKIIVKVENEIITNYDLKNKILTSLVLSGREINQKNIDNLKKSVLDQLIYLKLKKIELSKYKIPKDEKRINSYLSSISGNNIEDYKKKFNENSLDFELYLDDIDTEFRWQKLIYSMYQKKINITDEAVNKEIENIVKSQIAVTEFELSEIEINLNSNESFEDKIYEISQKIDNIGFENVALNFSSSTTASKKGYLGWINEKSLSKEIYNILAKLNPGNYSEPIKKQNKILFLKLNNKRLINPEEVDKERLKEKIIEKKRNELFNLYSQSRLSKLKSSSFIQY